MIEMLDSFMNTLNKVLTVSLLLDLCLEKISTVHGTWTVVDPVIDVVRGRLTYTYETQGFRNTFINPGLACFNLIREGRYKPSTELIGFSSDLFSDNKLIAYEVKISDEIITDFSELLKQAKLVFESKGELFIEDHVSVISKVSCSVDSISKPNCFRRRKLM